MNTSSVTNPATDSPPAIDRLAEQKRRIRAIKRVLIAKAEVRRLKALVGQRRIDKR